MPALRENIGLINTRRQEKRNVSYRFKEETGSGGVGKAFLEGEALVEGMTREECWKTLEFTVFF